MLGELGAVVESNGLTPLRRERAENGRHGVGNRVSFFRRGSLIGDESGAREGEYGLRC